MNYDENVMLEYISYVSEQMYGYDPNFDGYIQLVPTRIESVKNLTLEQQNKALSGLYEAGLIDVCQRGNDLYVKQMQKSREKPIYKPHSEEERRWINLAHHVPNYQHSYSLQDYLLAADRKGE